MADVICSECGKISYPAITKYGTRHICCGMWSWNGKPLATEKTHAARRETYEKFSELWQSGLTTKDDAYERLADVMDIPLTICNISDMDDETCALVMRLIPQIEEEIKA